MGPTGPTVLVAGQLGLDIARLRVHPAGPDLATALHRAPDGRAHLVVIGTAAATALSRVPAAALRSLTLVDAPVVTAPKVPLLRWQGRVTSPAFADSLRAHTADAEAARGHLVPIRVVAPDPAWPAWFAAEAAAVTAALGHRAQAVEHVGSTAVPGLAAKPIIDLQVGVEELEACVGPLRALGYSCWAADPEPDRRYLLRCADGVRTHHLQVVPHGSRRWRASLAFRDALRDDTSLATEYAALKHRLAAPHRTDREAYTAAKTDFVRAVLSRTGRT